MRTYLIVLVILLILIIAIQFFRPVRRNGGPVSEDISLVLPMSDTIKHILKSACYDCHSNIPRYPWYFNVQPIGWFLSGHIEEGREDLNFSEFGNYSNSKQLDMLEHIVHMVNDGDMPLLSYRLVHKDARLSSREKVLLTNWARNVTIDY
jgi:hypothetical protein